MKDNKELELSNDKIAESADKMAVTEDKFSTAIDKTGSYTNKELDDSYNVFDGMSNMDNAGSKYYLLDNDAFKKDKILPEILKEVIDASLLKQDIKDGKYVFYFTLF